jgi:hypothetical protein
VRAIKVHEKREYESFRAGCSWISVGVSIIDIGNRPVDVSPARNGAVGIQTARTSRI